MADNYLLVPMQLDVMVLNRPATNDTPFNLFEMQYQNLQQFKSPEPPPFTSTEDPATGIHLHWTLPKALRHGSHRPDGSTEFPIIPNRWLIVRTMADAVPGEGVKAWVLESDHVGADGTSPYVDPTGPDASGLPVATNIGIAHQLTPDLKSLATQNAPFLKALGPGNATFSLYSPGVKNVLSFYDDLTQNDNSQKIAAGTFSYYVAGWYSDPTHDPIADSNLEWVANTDANLTGTYVLQYKSTTDPDLIKYSFDWYAYAPTDDLPRQMLVHSLVSGVPWDAAAENAPAANYPADIANKVKVAIGATAIDALSGIVRLDRPSPAEADMLEAFQYGLLDKFDEPGSSEALNMAIRERWFGASPGGTLWTVVAPERTGNTGLPALPVPVVTPEQQAALADLNVKQYELDRQQRILESMQWNLFSLWWKNNWQQNVNNSVPDTTLTDTDWLATQLPLQMGVGSTCNNPSGADPASEQWYICKVNAQRNLVTAAAAAKTSAATSTEGLLAPDKLVLKAVNMPQYHYPSDPVVLVTGLGRSTNLDPTDGLMCRPLSQTVAALTINGTTYCVDSSGGTNIQPKMPALNDPNNLLPQGIQQFHYECFFLSPCLFAHDVLLDTTPCPAPAGGPPDTLAAAVSTAIGSLQPSAAAGARFGPMAFAAAGWQQPWVPLMLDWQVTVLEGPAYTTPAPGNDDPHLVCTFNQDKWKFNGTDYTWIGSTDPADFDETDSTMQLSGRTFITPQLNFAFAAQLDAYVQNHQMRDPALEVLLKDLDSYIDRVASQDILSQRLSGMMAMMIGRQFTQNVAPSGDIVKVFGKADSSDPDSPSGDYRHGYPMPSNTELNLGTAIWNFAPMGGTFFVITGLTVTDTFGRAIDLLQGNYSEYDGDRGGQSPAEDYFFPIAGRSLTAPSPPATGPAKNQGISSSPAARMIKLPPRLVQDSRLDFRLLSNDGLNTEIDRTAGANPICGWLVPNHLDRSLAVYAPDGTAWGELYLSKQDDIHFLPSWQPDPTKDPADPNAPQSVSKIPNVYMEGMLNTLNTRKDNGIGLFSFMQVIDETLWSINPRGQRQDQDLSVLIGRPLAVVRARLTMQLRGLPYYYQDWWQTFQIGFKLPDPSTAAEIGNYDGGVSTFKWPVRIGSNAMRDDGVIGYFKDDPVTPANSFGAFNCVVAPPADLPPSVPPYLNQITDGNYLPLRFVDDTVATPDPKLEQVCDITMLVDPRGKVHAFTGLLPVVTLDIPNQFVKPALQKMSYLFRAGPFLTAPDSVSIPRPAERKGTWTWFDNVIKTTSPITQADPRVRFPTTPPLAKEGWLKFTPNLAQSDTPDRSGNDESG